MLLSDLQNKDIISIVSGENLGRITDVEITSDGHIIQIYAEARRFFRRVFRHNDVTFKFSDIEKVGTDCILVKF